MNYDGIIIGVITFILIGVFHPIVIKGEYYFGAKIWRCFLIVGLILCVLSLFTDQPILSATLSIAGFSSLWGINELKEQEERVKKGWFPQNPNRKKKDSF